MVPCQRPTSLWFLLVVSLIVCLFCGQCDNSHPERLRVATDATYQPFSLVDKNGNLTGFDVELFREIGRRMGQEIEFVNQPFDGIIPGLQTKKFDAAIAAMAITPERSQQVDFSDPYFESKLAVMVREGKPTINSLEDLRTRSVGVQLATTGEMAARGLGVTNVRSYQSIDLAVIDLRNGAVDAVIDDESTARAVFAKKGGVAIFGTLPHGDRYAIAVRKGNAKTLARINDALKMIKASGFIDELRRRWIDGA